MEKIQPAHRMPALGKEQPEVLHVPLAPASVALQHIHQRRRPFFVASVRRAQQPHRVARLPHQRRLDEIMTQNVAAEWLLARQRRQRAVFDEGRRADDRIMAPVVCLSTLPVVQPRHERRSIQRLRKLHHTAQQRLRADLFRKCLQDADARILFHQAHHPVDQRAGHQAVRVQHHRVAVALPPPAAEVTHIPALAIDRLAPLAIKNLPERLELPAQLQPAHLLLDPLVRIIRIAQDEKVKVLEMPRLLNRCEDRAQSFKHTRHVLVVDRQNDRRRGLERPLVIILRQRVPQLQRIILRPVHQPHADQRRPEAVVELVIQRHKNNQQRDLRPAQPIGTQIHIQQPRAQKRAETHEGKERRASCTRDPRRRQTLRRGQMRCGRAITHFSSQKK